MISNILYIFLAIVMLGIIVTVHEFGHYVVGRLTGIGVVEFSVGFGPRLFGWERKGIQYSLRAIPLGGYCQFVGEDEVNSNPNAMNNQPVWKRFLTILAGPCMNFILAFIVAAILMGTFFIAETYPAIDAVSADMPAGTSGFQVDDVILSINGVEITQDSAGVNLMVETLQMSDLSNPVSIDVLRSEKTETLSVQPISVVDEATGEARWQIGIVFKGRTHNFTESLSASAIYMVDTTKAMLEGLRNLVFKGEGLEETAGPVGIIALVSERARDGFYMVLYLMFIISLNLGIMNLLPLPALDGGRLIFLIVEAVRGKPVPPEKEGLVHGLGMLLLLGLVVLLTINDIMRQFNGGF